jgi:hypothetical protein
MPDRSNGARRARRMAAFLAITLAALAAVRLYTAAVAGQDPAANTEILPAPAAPRPDSGFALRCYAVPWFGGALAAHPPPAGTPTGREPAPGMRTAWRITCTSLPRCLLRQRPLLTPRRAIAGGTTPKNPSRVWRRWTRLRTCCEVTLIEDALVPAASPGLNGELRHWPPLRSRIGPGGSHDCCCIE